MKSLKWYLVTGGVLLIIYIIAQLNRPKAIDWTLNLSNNEKTPFGTYVLYRRLNDIFPGSQIAPYRQPVYNVIAEDSIKQASYIIICAGIELSKADYEQLVKYIRAGNDVFLATGYFGKLLNKNLNIETQENFQVGSSGTPVNFMNPVLNPKKYFNVDKGADVYYFSKFDTLKATVLGENIHGQPTFIKYAFGKGALYLAANPKLFSNYSLLKPDGAEYAATALSFIKNTNRIIYDEYYTQGDKGESTPMRVFLSNPYLQWAYYIAIFSLLLFVLFDIKRTQRVIPVIEPLRNSTLDFVNVVGQVYYEKRNNANIAHKKILYLLVDLRDNYQLRTNKLDDEFTENLTAKLGVGRTFANELVNYIRYISVQDRVNDHELIELNKLIEQLYTQNR
jgi:hypothetical protein